jgi:hypothetical protein
MYFNHLVNIYCQTQHHNVCPVVREYIVVLCLTVYIP